MAVVNIQNIDGEKTSQIYLPDSIYNVEVKSHILHQVVKSQLAARRSGTASVKNRADIKGSTKKAFSSKRYW